MRPVRLELEGFTCFREKAEIDFSSLDLFAITGPTGAGKTSLIDAIVYVLYGRTPRLGEKSASELINQGSKRMSVRFEFTAGTKQCRVARTLKTGGSVTVRLEVDGDAFSKVGEVRDKVQEIVGLDFNGFTKAVVLPQGQFDQFLRGKADERRGILRDLLGLHVYEEMGRRARDRAKQALDEIRLLADLLAGVYKDGTEENRSALALNLARLQGELEAITAKRAVVDDALPLARDLRQHRSACKQGESDLEAAKRKLVEARTACASHTAEVRRLQNQLHQLDDRIAATGYNEKLYMRLRSLAPLASRRATLLESAAQGQRDIQRRLADRAGFQGKVEESGKRLDQAVRALKSSEKRFEQAAREYQQARKKHGSPDAIHAAAGALDSLDPRKKTALEKEIAVLDQKHQAAREQIKTLEKQTKQSTQAWEKASDALAHLQHVHSADDLRRRLKKGAECPVCGQIVRALPKAGRHAAIDEARKLVEERAGAKDDSAAALAQKQGELRALPAQIQAVRRNLGDIEATVTAAHERACALLGTSLGSSPAAELRKLAERIGKLESESAGAEADLQRVRQAESDARHAAQELKHQLDLAQRDIDSLENDAKAKSAELSTLEMQLAECSDAAALEKQVVAQEQARRKKDLYEQERKQADEQCRATEQSLAAAHAGVENYTERVQTCEKALAQTSAQISSLEASLRSKLPDLSPAPERDEAAQLEDLRSEIERAANDLRTEIARVGSRLESVSRQIAEAAEKRARIATLQAQAALHTELGQTLRADQFIRFILEHALRRLAAEGTRRLEQLSSARYSFATQEDDFFVIDHWNAGEKRSVHTLSGGESFLASLSLALALAEGLAEFSTDRESLRLESLFLDEGFSTLDPDTLEVVVEGIEALAGQDRLVGVISHVTELADRLPARVQVKKSPSGSTITVE